MLPLYALVEEKIRGLWDVRKADKMNAFPHGGSQTKQKRPAAKYSGAQELMLFYLEAQPEQLAQEVQPGCSSAQIRSAEGVHWSA